MVSDQYYLRGIPRRNNHKDYTVMKYIFNFDVIILFKINRLTETNEKDLCVFQH